MSISSDSFIVFTSNVFAILGLRSLYFALAGLMGMFHYLRFGLAAILSFVGIKMLLSHTAYKIPIEYALGFIVVALGITALVYGVVALIVKMDDVGLALAQRDAAGVAKLGRGMVQAMPKLLAVISVVGTAAMLWVGGHILLVGTHDLGWDLLYDAVHSLEERAHDAVGALGGVAGWLVNTVASALVGLVVGAVVVGLMSVTLHRRKAPAH